jgi:FMN hydrolase / 5-amino-6-(5-phospho-D-ribitylamino)uracil phosphatase
MSMIVLVPSLSWSALHATSRESLTCSSHVSFRCRSAAIAVGVSRSAGSIIGGMNERQHQSHSQGDPRGVDGVVALEQTIPGGVEYRLDPVPALVLFDLDKTLCDFDGARLARTRYAFEPHFDDEEQLVQAVDAAIAVATEGSEHFADILAAHGIDDPQLVELARARYIEDRYRGLKLFDETLDVVTAVSRIAKIGLVTNGPSAIQRPKIDLLGIEPYFPVIVVSEEAGVWKPDPGIFAIALERSGVTAADAIYVGDSAHHDVPGAHAAGMRAIWINRTHVPWPGGRPPDAEIHDLWELLPMLGLAREP